MATSKKEMALNATRWAEAAKKDLPKDMAFIFLFMPKDGIGQGQGVCAANVNRTALLDELKAVLKKFNEQPLILSPYDHSN